MPMLRRWGKRANRADHSAASVAMASSEPSSPSSGSIPAPDARHVAEASRGCGAPHATHSGKAAALSNAQLGHAHVPSAEAGAGHGGDSTRQGGVPGRRSRWGSTANGQCRWGPPSRTFGPGRARGGCPAPVSARPALARPEERSVAERHVADREGDVVELFKGQGRARSAREQGG